MNVATEVNQETLKQIASESIAKINPQAKDASRWINAINKATAEIESNPFLTFDKDTHSLLILSETSGQIYTANGTCECKAYERGFPCRHRAAARLISIYVERSN